MSETVSSGGSTSSASASSSTSSAAVTSGTTSDTTSSDTTSSTTSGTDTLTGFIVVRGGYGYQIGDNIPTSDDPDIRTYAVPLLGV